MWALEEAMGYISTFQSANHGAKTNKMLHYHVTLDNLKMEKNQNKSFTVFSAINLPFFDTDRMVLHGPEFHPTN